MHAMIKAGHNGGILAGIMHTGIANMHTGIANMLMWHKICLSKKRQKNCSFIAGRSLKGHDRAREVKVMGGATFDRIK